MNKQRGITLIALVVTIVVLLILAGVSIAMLGGDNGIVTQAQKAKEQTTISKEKESISLAKGAIRSRGEEVGKDNLQEELDRIEGEGKTEVTLKEDLSGLEIEFIDTNNKYEEGVTIEVSEEEQSYWTYEDNPDGTITLLKYNPPAEKLPELTELVVPNKIDGKKVKFIGSVNSTDPIWGDNISEDVRQGSGYSNKQTSIKKIIIQGNIQEISRRAFAYGEAVQDITIQDGITIIGEWAFSDCSNLTSINIPRTIINIEVGAFYYCRSLTSISIPNSVTSIGERALGGCSSLTTINLEASEIPSTWNSNWKGDCTAIVNTGVKM